MLVTDNHYLFIYWARIKKKIQLTDGGKDNRQPLITWRNNGVNIHGRWNAANCVVTTTSWSLITPALAFVRLSSALLNLNSMVVFSGPRFEHISLQARQDTVLLIETAAYILCEEKPIEPEIFQRVSFKFNMGVRRNLMEFFSMGIQNHQRGCS